LLEEAYAALGADTSAGTPRNSNGQTNARYIVDALTRNCRTASFTCAACRAFTYAIHSPTRRPILFCLGSPGLQLDLQVAMQLAQRVVGPPGQAVASQRLPQPVVPGPGHRPDDVPEHDVVEALEIGIASALDSGSQHRQLGRGPAHRPGAGEPAGTQAPLASVRRKGLG
jgi:hypothetical protein